MSDRESHGMNCAHRSDSDEPCTCACRHHAVDTERTMHAAWRKRAEEAEAENADFRARLADAEKARDEQAEAVRVLAHEAANAREFRRRLVEYTMSYLDAKGERTLDLERRLIAGYSTLKAKVDENPTAAAAVKEASNASE